MDTSSAFFTTERNPDTCTEALDKTIRLYRLPERRLYISDGSTSRYFRSWLLLASSALMVTQVAGARGLDEVFVIRLYGTNEIGHPGDPDGRGEARLNFDASSDTCFFEISLSGITEPTHIGILNGGPLDTSGSGIYAESGTMVTLMSAATRVDSSGYGRYHITGSSAIPDYIIADVTSKPWEYYMQVWTSEYEYGAVRAQLQDETSGVAVTYSDSSLDNWSGTASNAAKASVISAAKDPTWEASIVGSQSRDPTAASQIQNPASSSDGSLAGRAQTLQRNPDGVYFLPAHNSVRAILPDRSQRKGLARYLP